MFLGSKTLSLPDGTHLCKSCTRIPNDDLCFVQGAPGPTLPESADIDWGDLKGTTHRKRRMRTRPKKRHYLKSTIIFDENPSRPFRDLNSYQYPGGFVKNLEIYNISYDETGIFVMVKLSSFDEFITGLR